MTLMRLQRALARAGVTSRRKAEDLIRAGRVRVDGLPASLGASVDPNRQRLTVDGRAGADGCRSARRSGAPGGDRRTAGADRGVARARSAPPGRGGEGGESRHRGGADPRGRPAAHRAPPRRAVALEGGMAASRRLRAGTAPPARPRRAPPPDPPPGPGDPAPAWAPL